MDKYSLYALFSSDVYYDSSLLIYSHKNREESNFFARSYKFEDKVVIAFRGTDKVPADAWSGWGVGVGSVTSPQLLAAIEFYHETVSKHPNKEIVFTGHSLGGGLAGFLGAIYQKKSYVFDNMRYTGAVENLWELYLDYYNETYKVDDPDLHQAIGAHLEKYYGEDVHKSDMLAKPQFNLSQAAHIDGEFLDNTARGNSSDEYSVADQAGLWPIQKHSMSLLSIVMHFSEGPTAGMWKGPSKDDWDVVSSYLLPHLFDEKLAEVSGIKRNTEKKAIDNLRDKIAFSLLDKDYSSGARHALYKNIEILAEAIEDGLGTILQYDDNLKALFATAASGAVAQFVAMLADANAETNNLELLRYDSANKVLAINCSKAFWSTFSKPPEELFGVKALMQAVKEQETQELFELLEKQGISGSLREIDVLTFQVEDTGLGSEIRLESYGDKKVVFIGSSSADTILGSSADEVIIANGVNNDTADMVSGGAGNDLLIGTNSVNFLTGGDGADVVYGGYGDDTLDGGVRSDLMPDDANTFFDSMNTFQYYDDNISDILDGGKGYDKYYVYHDEKYITDTTSWEDTDSGAVPYSFFDAIYIMYDYGYEQVRQKFNVNDFSHVDRIRDSDGSGEIVLQKTNDLDYKHSFRPSTNLYVKFSSKDNVYLEKLETTDFNGVELFYTPSSDLLFYKHNGDLYGFFDWIFSECGSGIWADWLGLQALFVIEDFESGHFGINLLNAPEGTDESYSPAFATLEDRDDVSIPDTITDSQGDASKDITDDAFTFLSNGFDVNAVVDHEYEGDLKSSFDLDDAEITETTLLSNGFSNVMTNDFHQDDFRFI
ncbi:calcium-binding protein [Polycladidibacter stylochi]|uniref:calcium-binding protein n=1 Tax=Polycladidibacter stylochi TaxID=1807766 RepID=UPI00082ECA1A|nr:calcium-binding protein [Pseudovibrio stylochi]